MYKGANYDLIRNKKIEKKKNKNNFILKKAHKKYLIS